MRQFESSHLLAQALSYSAILRLHHLYATENGVGLGRRLYLNNAFLNYVITYGITMAAKDPLI